MKKKKDEIKELLERELKSELEGLYDTNLGDEDHQGAVDNVVKLYELKIKDEKGKDDAKDQKFKFGLEAMGIGLPLVVYVALFFKGLKFEECGSVNSHFVRNLTGKFKLGK